MTTQNDDEGRLGQADAASTTATPPAVGGEGCWRISYKCSGSRRHKQPPYLIHYAGLEGGRHAWVIDPAEAACDMTTQPRAQAVADAILAADPRMKPKRIQIDWHRA